MKLIRDKLLPFGVAVISVLTGGVGWAGEEGALEASAPSADGTADDATIELDCLRTNAPFAWNCAGPVAGMVCTQILEPADPDTWSDNYFCSSPDLGIRWSFGGAISGCDVRRSTSPPSHPNISGVTITSACRRTRITISSGAMEAR